MFSLNAQMNELGNGLKSLTFEEFSWKDKNGGYELIPAANILKVLTYLRTHYPEVSTTIDEMPPYLVIWCEETVLEPSKRPFLIGGLLAVWIVEGQSPPVELNLGFLGNLEMRLHLDDDLAEDIRKYHIPKTDTLRQLMRKGFPNALAVSFISNEIFVELPELPRHEHAARLKTYPGLFAHGGPMLFYYSGLLFRTQRNDRKLEEAKPHGLEGKLLSSDMLKMDDIYVIDNEGTGCHGAMLCKGKTVISQNGNDEVVLGVFATSDSAAYGDPSIRAGCCGSALVRLEKSREAEGGFEKSGKIGGVIVASELEGGSIRDNTPRLLCFAEVNDALIEAGGEAV
ncbi:hypothetical protein V502_05666 [Pseudogymnoascus sp. VKM F-4520 (FW-2644)]|nr:hypothetical protein V502_05666 [Pseudogymnoascus sp. VKM F-4520 (FW-2644)]